MALIFSRLARSHIKNGYFPTDDLTLAGIQSALVPGLPSSTRSAIRVLDPCCGTGAALADLCAHLVEQQGDWATPHLVETYGIELDKARAWEAKKLLLRALHADVHDVVVKPRTCSLLFLNPPYGFGVPKTAGQGAITEDDERADRLERTFIKRTVPLLMPDGILVLIIPFYAIDDEIRSYLARHFADLTFHMAPTQQFQQCVIMGRKIKPLPCPDKAAVTLLTRAQAGELKEQILPEVWADAPYVVPGSELQAGAEGGFDFRAVRIDAEQLSDELHRIEPQLLWNGFEQTFNQVRALARRPLRDMSRWHLALALAAGQVTGVIRSEGGRTLLIKGDTYKRKERTKTVAVDEDGNVSETVTMLDKFVPVISAIEFTPGPYQGRVIRIS